MHFRRMILYSVATTNFRSLLDVTLGTDPVTILIGPNGCGKSNLLHALRLFYEQAYPISESCFFARDTATPITVTLEFASLTPQELEIFAPYVESERLTVVKEVQWNDGSPSAKYYGMRRRCPGFQHIRQLAGRGKKDAYNTLVTAATHAGLTTVRTIEEVDPALEAWETTHPDQCERMRDDGQFFGWTGVAQGRIDRFSKFLFIPAVREAGSDGQDTKGSALKDLVDIFLRPKLQEHPDIKALQADASTRFKEILRPENVAELRLMSDEITNRLRSFSPGTSVTVGWRSEGQVQLNLPATGTSISEGRFSGPIEHAGHGTQRAFLIAILQYLVDARIAVQAESGALPPHVLLGIEEPELYLHPTRARLMSRVLQKLSEGEGGRIQSIYATHSPLFVDLGRFNSVRMGRRVPGSDPTSPSRSEFSLARLEAVAAKLAAAHGADPSTYSAERLLPRLTTLMTPYVSEGFFADVALLVEGEEDRAFILAAAAHAGHDFEALGVAVLPVGGKTNLDRPFVIFTALGIPSYIVFDGDSSKPARDAHRKANKALLVLATGTGVETPATRVGATAASFADCMATTVTEEIGPRFAEILAQVADEYGYDELKQAKKNPKVVSETLDRCNREGLNSATLKGIVDAVAVLRPAQ